MTVFPDSPKRTPIDKAGLGSIYARQFGTPNPEALKGFTKAHLESRIQTLGKCECGCKQPLKGRGEWEHTIPLKLQYKGDKPKWAVWLPACHKAKTKDDVKRIAKAKRQAGLTGQYARRQKNGSKWQKGQKLPTGRKLKSRNTFNNGWTPNERIDG